MNLGPSQKNSEPIPRSFSFWGYPRHGPLHHVDPTQKKILRPPLGAAAPTVNMLKEAMRHGGRHAAYAKEMTFKAYTITM